MKKFDYKKAICIALIILGIAGIIYGIHSMHRISTAQQYVDKVAHFFSGRPETPAFQEMMNQRIGQYHIRIRSLFIISGLLIILGCSGVVYFWKKK